MGTKQGIDSAVQMFREEAQELLGGVEEALLELETDPASQSNVAKVFRSLHTIKGTASLFGFEGVSRFIHEMESVLDQVRTGALPITRDLLSAILAAKDHILALLADSGTPASGGLADTSRVLAARLKDCLANGPAEESPHGEEPEREAGKPRRPEGRGTYWIRYKPRADAFRNGTDPLVLLENLRSLGKTWHVFRRADLPSLDALDPEKVYGSWDVLLVTARPEADVRDVFVFVEGDHQVEIHRLSDMPIREADVPGYLDILGRNGTEEAMRLAQAAIRSKVAMRGAFSRAGAAGEPSLPELTSIRVDAARLDKLVNLVGEFVSIQSRLHEVARDIDQPALASVSEDLQRLSEAMSDQALGMRMVPIGGIFGSLRRLVRDLSGELGKDIAFTISGAETELDKNMIDSLKDPLMHLLRNCADHGIEPPEERLAKGKARQGRVELTAEHSGGKVVITISDDGAGIDVQAVRAKAVEKGLIQPGDDLSEKEAVALLFTPGFSTARTVSSVSGRGVGLDVVRANIEAMRGRVDVQTTPGAGTTFFLRLPLTLAIIDGLQVLVGPESYVLPLHQVIACQERFLSEAPPAVDSIEYRDRLIPCISLRRVLGADGEQPAYERIVIVNADDQEVGLAVDSVVGQQRAVTKSVSPYYQHIKWISGVTITGNGRISLIVDAARLVQNASGQAS